MDNFVFFTLRDLNKGGGGAIRIKGILNALSKENKNIILISKNYNKEELNANIKHIPFDITINSRIFQLSLALFPNFINKILFFTYLKKFNKNIPDNLKKEIIFFEYLDNSFGYFLKKNNIIKSYINDIHGVAPLEFKYNEKKNIYNLFRYKVSLLLDYKVMKNTSKIIAVSEAMKNYFLNEYSFLKNKIIVIPDGISQKFCSQSIDNLLFSELQKKYIQDNKKNILFAGDFKDLGGVLDLINAFIKVTEERTDIKLFLIGDGEHLKNAQKLVKSSKIEHLVYFIGRVPYERLKTYQELADIIICPDKQHPYSNLIIHIKYFDSLASNKIVINGNFESTKNINKDERLSINFEPSNPNDLANKIHYVLDNLEKLKIKYKDNAKIICNNYTYEKFTKGF